MTQGTVYKSTGSWYLVKARDKFLECRIKGKIRLKNISTTNPIAVGDHVIFELENDGNGIISDILPRTNYIIRKSVNLSKQHHIIASNIDISVCIIYHKDRFLIFQRPQNKMLGGLWEFPGGKIELGESKKAAAIREIEEETNLSIINPDYIGEVKHQYSHFKVTISLFLKHVNNVKTLKIKENYVNFKKITYQDVTEEKLAPAREIEKVCKKYNVEMGAAALQFSMKDKRITSTLCGVTSILSIEKNLAWANTNIPEEFWNEVLKLPYSTKDPESERNYTPG